MFFVVTGRNQFEPIANRAEGSWAMCGALFGVERAGREGGAWDWMAVTSGCLEVAVKWADGRSAFAGGRRKSLFFYGPQLTA